MRWGERTKCLLGASWPFGATFPQAVTLWKTFACGKLPLFGAFSGDVTLHRCIPCLQEGLLVHRQPQAGALHHGGDESAVDKSRQMAASGAFRDAVVGPEVF